MRDRQVADLTGAAGGAAQDGARDVHGETDAVADPQEGEGARR
ncbi:putative ROK family protein [Streptomyces sp. Tu6071]|nr:putative ROK family protein [Streptomyces sp. Tu6071]